MAEERQGAGEAGAVPLRFDEAGLIPAVVQEAETGEVLMLAYMNREALVRTLQEGRTWFWSRSRQQLWPKGATSGQVQDVLEVLADCDGDALLLRVRQHGGGACHTGQVSCFHQPLTPTGPATSAALPTPDASLPAAEAPAGSPAGAEAESAATSDLGQVLAELYGVIADRRANPRPGSYTSTLFREGRNRIVQKVGEEAIEVVIAGKDQAGEALVYEVGDLLYHLLVLLVERGISLEQLAAELRRRRR